MKTTSYGEVHRSSSGDLSVKIKFSASWPWFATAKDQFGRDVTEADVICTRTNTVLTIARQSRLYQLPPEYRLADDVVFDHQHPHTVAQHVGVDGHLGDRGPFFHRSRIRDARCSRGRGLDEKAEDWT